MDMPTSDMNYELVLDGDLDDGDREELKDEQKTVMSVVWQAGMLGMAYIDLSDMELFCMQDIAESDERGDFETLKIVMSQVQPDIVITSSKQSGNFLNALKAVNVEQSSSDGTADVNAATECRRIVETISSGDFVYEVSKRRLVNASFIGIPMGASEREKATRMAAMINFDCVQMVRAAGALVKALEAHRFDAPVDVLDKNSKASNLTTPTIFTAISSFVLGDTLIIDANSLNALQIFRREAHPSSNKISYKEGLSVFGLFNRTHTALGSKRLRLWFMRPTRNTKVLKGRFDAIEYFVSSERGRGTMREMSDTIRSCGNTRTVITSLRRGRSSLADWKLVVNTVASVLRIRSICLKALKEWQYEATEHDDDNDVVFFMKRIICEIKEELSSVIHLIKSIIDFEQSSIERRIVVHSGLDDSLDALQHEYAGLPDLLSQVAAEEIPHILEANPHVTAGNIVYYPQLGYLLAVPRRPELVKLEDFEIPGLVYQFSTNSNSHYKSPATFELDERLGDIHGRISNRELEIIQALTTKCLEYEAQLEYLTDIVAELDCLVTLAQCAIEFDLCRPVLQTSTPTAFLNIRKGRHLLQEMCVDSFIANDTQMGMESSSSGEIECIHVFTSPNASGKSIYMKQVAIIVFLAHIGSFVPALEAQLSLFDRIETRIHSIESVSICRSAFLLDLIQVSAAIRHSTPHSLIILDEFGSSTDFEDGAALLGATLNHFIDRGFNSPLVLVSTHFHELFRREGILPEPLPPWVRMKTMGILHTDNGIVMLFSVIDGTADSSYGSHIAALSGIPHDVVARGIEVSQLIRERRQIPPLANTDGRAVHDYAAIVQAFADFDLTDDSADIEELRRTIENCLHT